MEFKSKDDIRKIINNLLQPNNEYECPVCKNLYKKYGITNHIYMYHTEEGKDFRPGKGNKGKIPWNKGKTKNDDERINEASKKTSFTLSENPTFLGKKHTKDSKKSISNSMKKAHQEGRAWNIGMNKWKGESSYPEKFFEKVIENEFDNKNYTREYQFSKYKIDFAWVNEKLAIEIDSSLHEEPSYKARDVRKDKLLSEDGWKVLRIKWIDMFNNPKEWIKISKNYINNGSVDR